MRRVFAVIGGQGETIFVSTDKNARGGSHAHRMPTGDDAATFIRPMTLSRLVVARHARSFGSHPSPTGLAPKCIVGQHTGRQRPAQVSYAGDYLFTRFFSKCLLRRISQGFGHSATKKTLRRLGVSQRSFRLIETAPTTDLVACFGQARLTHSTGVRPLPSRSVSPATRGSASRAYQCGRCRVDPARQ